MKEDSLGVSMEVKPETPGTTEWALRERIKELTCLYLVSQELQKQKSLEELCPLIVEYLVPAMQFPEITVPVIKMGNRQFTTRKYSERLSHGLHAEIRLQEQVLGHLSVYYEEDRPFLIPEEQRLVNAIAEGLSLWSEGRQAEESLLSALEESRKRQGEIAALLEGSRAVLECREFEEAARSIFHACKQSTGATAGYVALLSKDGTENEVLFLDPGGLPCIVDPYLPMPIRGLRAEAYRNCRAAYDNDFSRSAWMKFMPAGHVSLENVLFAPLTIEGQAVGILGIANKPGGFNEDDARLASGFGELAAIALLNCRRLESLEHSEERFRSVAQSAIDAIISADDKGNIVFWNRAAESMFGYAAEEALGKLLSLIIPDRYQQAHRDGMQRVSATGESRMAGKTVECSGRRKDGSEFPVELSVAAWQTKEGVFFGAVCRDITRRKSAEEALRKAHDELEKRVEERTFELLKANAQLEREIRQRRFLASQILTAQETERRRISRELHDELGQSLTVMKLRVSFIEKELQGDQVKAREECKRTMEYLNLIMDNVRRLSRELSPSILEDLGLTAALRWLFNNFIKNNEMQLTFNIAEIDPLLSRNEQMSIYRILQEALTNIGKHAQAKNIKLLIEKDEDRILFFLEDDGKGFDPRKVLMKSAAESGWGLATMEERARMLGGSLDLWSQEGKGTQISIRIPTAKGRSA
jgi:PAS domain S-box-containing protein